MFKSKHLSRVMAGSPSVIVFVYSFICFFHYFKVTLPLILATGLIFQRIIKVCGLIPAITFAESYFSWRDTFVYRIVEIACICMPWRWLQTRLR